MEPLIKIIEKKRKKTLQKVEDTIKVMIKQKQKINFNSVAEKSGVSKSFLYKYSDIRNRIKTLRKQEEELETPKQVKREMTEQSKDEIIASLRKRNKALEKKNINMKEK